MDGILDGLNPEQRRAVETPTGPVCILAGAGTGKTTTITRRIAHQVVSGAFTASAILAVTFTDKAAKELRRRLGQLGVERVNARTFHSAALAQLRGLAAAPPERVLASKVLLLRQIANGLPRPYRFRPAADLATAIEWAKNRRLGPAAYADSADAHDAPLPPDLLVRVYREYERRKTAGGLVDFEDLLERTIRLFEDDAEARSRFRARYRAFTVDEYQDVNLLQQTLLDHWLGDGDELCAVGDDYQSIYGFTGATPAYLLALPERFPHATVIRLEENYRSTPQVLALANRLVPGLGGSRKTLRAARPAGPEPVVRRCADRAAEVRHVVETVEALGRGGVPYEEMAVLYRVNARSEEFEEAFSAAAIPFGVRAGAFLTRPAARRLLASLRGSGATTVAADVRRAALLEGWLEELPEGLGESETSRQLDLARLVELARAFDDGRRTGADFATELERRFADDGGGHGVNLLTLHRAKGLEFDAVFVPRVEEGELPSRPSAGDGRVAEERRLLYVGLTRARRHLHVTYAGKPSRFLRELGHAADARPASPAGADLPPSYGALREWRRRRAAADGVPAYVVFHDRTLVQIAERRPQTTGELSGIPGVGPVKLERYGEDVLATLSRQAASDR